MFEKIISIYPELASLPYIEFIKYITLQNDSDGKGDYIAKWEHPTLARPTEDQLK